MTIKGEFGSVRMEQMSQIKAVCFDLFDTLADAHRQMEDAECSALGVSREEWGKAMWEDRLCRDRGLGIIKTVREMIDRACAMLPAEVTETQKNAAEKARLARLKAAVTEIDPAIVHTVRRLKENGYQVGLISNADVCDRYYWEQSPLFPYFDDSIFSCDAGLVKPDREIYLLSAERLGVLPSETVFVGDGGSDELFGAKAAGMKTVCTEYLVRYPQKKRRQIHQHADRILQDFEKLPELIGKM